MKRFWAAVVLTLGMFMPAAACAYGLQSSENVSIPKGETRAGTFYALGQNVTIDGDVNGDLVCAGQTVTVNGSIHGDVLCAGQTVTVNGPVDGSVRIAGQTVNVGGTVGRNVTIAAQSLILSSSAHVAGDAGLLGQLVNVNGPVDRTVYGAISQLTLANKVGDVDVRVDNFHVTGDGAVAGDVKYTSSQMFALDTSKIGGKIQYSAPPQRNNVARASLAARLYWIVAMTVTGLVLAALAPRLMRSVSRRMRERGGLSLGVGLIITLLAPLVVVLLLLTVIGIPLAVLLGILWFIFVAGSSIFAGVAVGQWLLERAGWQRESLVWSALLGIPFVIILFNVPVVGPIVAILATWWAVGGVALAARSLHSVQALNRR